MKLLHKFRSLALTAALLLSAQLASAQVVQVEGYGQDRQSALRDAERAAVEQVAGTYIDSRTMTENYMVKFDEICAKAQGFVRNSRVLQEGLQGGAYRVLASVDVDTNPDAALISNLSALMRLNDPRIAVVVLDRDGEHDELLEEAMNGSLVDMGFSHVVDAQLVGALQDAQLLEQIYNGSRRLGEVGASYGADYLVLGKVETDSRQISLPNYRGGYQATQLVTGRANLTVKLVRFATGEIIGSFSLEGQGVENGAPFAETKARREVAGQAAQKVVEKFKRVGAQATTGVQVIAYASDYGSVEALAAQLRQIGGVGSVYIREHRGGKAILELDSTQPAEFIARELRQRGYFIDSISGSSLTVAAR